MKNYEYKTIFIRETTIRKAGKSDASEIDKQLNEMGKDGWELQTMTAFNVSYGNTKRIVCVFKRELTK